MDDGRKFISWLLVYIPPHLYEDDKSEEMNIYTWLKCNLLLYKIRPMGAKQKVDPLVYILLLLSFIFFFLIYVEYQNMLMESNLLFCVELLK